MTTITQPGSLGEQKPTEPMTVHTVQGGGGLRLHVREWGRPDGPPILLIHGISASHLCWARQYQSKLAKEFRLVAYDLRGHGMSQAPLEPEHYTNAKLWADDVAAIIQQLGLERPVLVGWSYGGYIICDYLRAHGQDRIGAIDFAGGATKLGPAAAETGSPVPFRTLESQGRSRPATPLWTQLGVVSSLLAAGMVARPGRTWMRLGVASSILGTRIWSTPLSAEAWIPSAITWAGRVIERRKAP